MSNFNAVGTGKDWWSPIVNTDSTGDAGFLDGFMNFFTGNKDWERQQIMNERQQSFNAMEAQKNRDWQERMSNTAYQRQVADMKAAGINPYAALSHGASVGGGATASASQAGVGSSGRGFGALLSFIGNIATSAISAVSRNAIANKAAFNAMERQTEYLTAMGY